MGHYEEHSCVVIATIMNKMLETNFIFHVKYVVFDKQHSYKQRQTEKGKKSTKG